jgi:hypothetical protein
MAIPHSALMVELLMSADRVITAAQSASMPPEPEAWPPAVIVAHLSQVDEQVWIPRLALMTTAPAVPSFSWWEPDAVETAARFATTGVDDAAALLLASRTRLLHDLRDLTDEQWSARARHDVFGELDVEGLMLQTLGHDEEHRATLLLGDG